VEDLRRDSMLGFITLPQQGSIIHSIITYGIGPSSL